MSSSPRLSYSAPTVAPRGETEKRKVDPNSPSRAGPSHRQDIRVVHVEVYCMRSTVGLRVPTVEGEGWQEMEWLARMAGTNQTSMRSNLKKDYGDLAKAEAAR